MDKQTFLAELKNALIRENDIDETMILSSLPEWDSLGIMCVVTMFDECFSINLDFYEIDKYKTVKDLMKLAGIE